MKEQLDKIRDELRRLERRCMWRRYKLNWIDPDGITVAVESAIDQIREAVARLVRLAPSETSSEEQGRRMLRDLPVTALHAPRYGRRKRRTAKG